MLKAAFPGAHLTACDINRGGVDFCAETFGASPVYSAEAPTEISLPGPFDLIWCGSLFTHLDADRWPGFLKVVFWDLGVGGVAVLTTHGREAFRRLRRGDTYGLDQDQIATILRGFGERGFG